MTSTAIVLGDNGSLTFWDYATGTAFQNLDDIPQPGSLEAEAGVFCSTFDQTGTRLITGGADKTIKVWFSITSNPANSLSLNSRSTLNNHSDSQVMSCCNVFYWVWLRIMHCCPT